MPTLLSFIIPAYNIASKVERCLRSIARLPLDKEEMEVVVIDDASTDDTAAVCEQLLTELGLPHTVMTQPKSGQATGRNRGLTIARGQYVWMVDGDDEVVLEGLQQLRKVLTSPEKYDMVTFNHDEVHPDDTCPVCLFAEQQVLAGIEFLRQSRGGSYLWDKIYRREAIRGVRFIDGLTHIEDMCFNVHALAQIRKVLCLPVTGYRYYRSPKAPLAGEAFRTERKKANDDSFAVYQSLYDLRNLSTGELRSILDEKLNFEVIAHLYYVFRYDTVAELRYYVTNYKVMGIYPMHKTSNWKANVFRLLVNHPNLLFTVKQIRTHS